MKSLLLFISCVLGMDCFASVTTPDGIVTSNLTINIQPGIDAVTVMSNGVKIASIDTFGMFRAANTYYSNHLALAQSGNASNGIALYTPNGVYLALNGTNFGGVTNNGWQFPQLTQGILYVDSSLMLHDVAAVGNPGVLTNDGAGNYSFVPVGSGGGGGVGNIQSQSITVTNGSTNLTAGGYPIYGSTAPIASGGSVYEPQSMDYVREYTVFTTNQFSNPSTSIHPNSSTNGFLSNFVGQVTCVVSFDFWCPTNPVACAKGFQVAYTWTNFTAGVLNSSAGNTLASGSFKDGQQTVYSSSSPQYTTGGGCWINYNFTTSAVTNTPINFMAKEVWTQIK